MLGYVFMEVMIDDVEWEENNNHKPPNKRHL